MPKLKNLLLIVSLSLNVAAICAIVILVLQQSPRTLRQITGIGDNQVTQIDIAQNRYDGQLYIITDKAKIKEFMNRFFDGFRMATPTGRSNQTESIDYLIIRLYRSKSSYAEVIIGRENPSSINMNDPAKAEYGTLTDKTGFIRQLNTFMKTISPAWKEYRSWKV